MKTLVATILIALAGNAHADDSAENLFAQGQAAYDRGDWQTAIARWQGSYQLSGEDDLLFNIAQAQRLAGDCPTALSTYRRFLAADPTADQHGLAEDLARELEIRCPASPKLAVSKPAVPSGDPEPKTVPRLNLVDRLSTPEDHKSARRVAGIAIGGGGALTLTIGLALGHHGQTLGDDVSTACKTRCNWAEQKDKDASGRRDVTIGRVLDVAGLAAIAGGAVLYYLGRRDESLSVAPTPRNDGAAVTWSGSW